MIRAALGALSIAVALALSNVARADGAELVTLVKPTRDDAWLAEATTRLAAELRSAGFQVRIVKGAEPTAARQVATIAIVPTESGAETDVWVNDIVTEELRVRRFVATDASLPNAASDLAVRSVELLRASLMKATPPQRKELAPRIAAWLDEVPAPVLAPPPTPAAPSPSSSPAPASPSATAPVEIGPSAAPPSAAAPVERRAEPGPATAPAKPSPLDYASLEAAFGFLVSPGGHVAFVPILARASYELPLEYALPYHVGVRLTGASALPVAPSNASGSIDVRQTFFVLEQTGAFSWPSVPVIPRLSVGGGVYVLHADGHPAGSSPAQHPTFVSAAATGSAGLAIKIRPGLALVGDVQALVLQNQPAVTADGIVVFRAGRPAIAGAFGLQAHF